MTYFKSWLVLVAFLCSFAGCKEKGHLNVNSDGREYSANTVLNSSSAFYVDTITIEHENVTEFDSLGFAKKKFYNFKACFGDIAKKSRMAFRQFRISDGNQADELHSDQNGCVFWYETIEFDYYTRESYMWVKRQFTELEGQGEMTVGFLLDPWTVNELIFHAQGYTKIPPNLIAENANGATAFSAKLLPKAKTPAKLVITEIKLTWNGISEKDFEIDNQLSLYVAQNYWLDIKPEIVRPNLSSEVARYPVQAGKFKLTMVLVKDDPRHPDIGDFENYITHLETVLEFDRLQGNVRQETILKFPDISATTTRMKVIVRLEALNVESEYLAPAFFSGRIESLPGSNIILDEDATRDLSLDLKSLIFQAQAENEKRKVTAEELFKLQPNTKVIHMNELKKFIDFASGRARITDFIAAARKNPAITETTNQGLNFIQQLKHFVMPTLFGAGLPDNGRATAEARDMQWAFRKLKLVEKILTPTPTMSNHISPTEIFKVSVAFNEVIRNSYKFEAGAFGYMSAGLKLPQLIPTTMMWPTQKFGLGGQIGINGEWSRTWLRAASSEMESKSEIQINSVKRQLTARAMIRNCFLIQTSWPVASATLIESEATNGTRQQHFVLLCDDEAKEEAFTESYFLITDDIDSNSWVDGKSFRYHTWLQFMRGESRFGYFRDLLHKKSFNLDYFNDINRDLKRVESVAPQATTQRIDQVFPGVLMDDL